MLNKIDLRISRERLVDFCKRNGIRKLSLYGSVLKKTMRPDSDIDLLVEFYDARLPGFFSLCRMENELCDLFGRKVDLRTPQELSRYFRDEVLRTAEVQYES